MADECIPCGKKKRVSGPIPPKKKWRVITADGRRLDYVTETDADASVRKHGGLKRKLAS